MTESHAPRLARVETEVAELRKGLDVVFTKLDTIVSAVHELRGTAGPSLQAVMTMVFQGTVMFSLLAGGIIYLARGGNNDAIHQLDIRQTRVETIIGLTLGAKRTPMSWDGVSR
jgi:hypothetical protein